MARRKQDNVTETVTNPAAGEAGGRDELDEAMASQLAEQARAEGTALTGPDGLLGRLTKMVLETGLEAEMSEHVGYEAHAAEGRNGGNSRNGARPKTVTTDVGPVEIDVPRDRDGSFDPKMVRKHQRRLSGVDEMVCSLTAKGLDDRGSLGAPGRGLRRRGLPRHHLQDHRPGARGNGGMAEPAAGPDVSGHLHRRYSREDSRRAGR